MTLKLKLSLNDNCVDKTDPHKLAKGWKPVEEDVDYLMKWVGKGWGWCATHFAGAHRKEANALCSNLIAVDVDGDCTLDDFWATQTAKDWCLCTYTSASHSDEEHRFRALFPLGRELVFPTYTNRDGDEVANVAEHIGAYWLIVNRLLGELGLERLKDNSGEKPERLWYGSRKREVRKNPDATPVPEVLLENIGDEHDITELESRDVSPEDVERCKWVLTWLAPSEDSDDNPDRDYNNYFVKVMAACASMGADMWDAWEAWAKKGHHARKEGNLKRFKWKTMGKSGPGALYALAKKQRGTNWTDGLEPRLRFKPQMEPSEPAPTMDIPKEQQPPPGNTTNKPEPTPQVPDSKPKRGRAAKSDEELADQRATDVEKVQQHLPGLRRNVMTWDIEYQHEGRFFPLAGDWGDTLTNTLCIQHKVYIPEARMKCAVKTAASFNQVCPVQEYLKSCKGKTPYEGWNSLGKIFLGNDDPLANKALQRVLIGAVARAMDPGCPMDWLPVLVGGQGVGKTAFVSNLAPNDFFVEMTAPLEKLISEPYRMHRGWVVEFGEIDKYFAPKYSSDFKLLISTKVDQVRRNYEEPTSMKRRFVILGTTNKSQFLVDATGNRRFIPIEVGDSHVVPIDELKQHRDNIWAAAMDAYNAGQTWLFAKEEVGQLQEHIMRFNNDDPWQDTIKEHLCNRRITQVENIRDLLTSALGISVENQSRKESNRAIDVMQSLGWSRRKTTVGSSKDGSRRTARVWEPPDDWNCDDVSIDNDF